MFSACTEPESEPRLVHQKPCDDEKHDCDRRRQVKVLEDQRIQKTVSGFQTEISLCNTDPGRDLDRCETLSLHSPGNNDCKSRSENIERCTADRLIRSQVDRRKGQKDRKYHTGDSGNKNC